MKEQDYRFWVDRIGYSNKLFDIIRIDHFRAFDTYWKIPADCPTAIDGEWIEHRDMRSLIHFRKKFRD